MECHKPILHIRPRAHLLGAAQQDAHLPGAHLGEQFLFPSFGIGVMDIGDLVFWDAHRHELHFQIVIDIEAAVILGGGEIAEHKLRPALLRGLLPYPIDIPGAGGHLSIRVIQSQRVD